MSSTNAATTAPSDTATATTPNRDAALVEIGRLAIAAQRAHVAWANARNYMVSPFGPDGVRDLLSKKGATERALREAIQRLTGE